ncbi:undecaprenyl-phosphate glucose phosphotransferase [Fodinisporobacter ferrooxydans]|uniref:Undecaprenyl-phosphate glucose phosphotransferase n=1 Tax=Fodinisporobacter ferrooxydans TaxID=2901836 RepID=A0ABY4CME7_9BACL|nr:undecaprenyl-phosphate glucose phosphotransferase [Alicyclobacillaceae bacterium MYW30-H2]
MIRAYQKLLNRLFMVLDSLLITLSLFLAWYIRFHSGWFPFEGRLKAGSYFSVLIYIIPVFLFFNSAFGLYSSKRAKRFRAELLGIIKSLFFTGFFTIAGLFFIKQINYSRAVLLSCFILVFVLMSIERLVLRMVLRRIRAKGFNKKHILIIGAGELGQRFLQSLREHPEFGYEALGFLDDALLHAKNTEVDGVPILGTLDKYKSLIEKHHLDQVFIALPLSAHPRLAELIASSERMGIQTFIIPDYYGYLPAKPRIEDFGGIPLIDVRHVPLDDVINGIVKRTFDICVSSMILLLLLPLLLVIGIGIKLTSPGPIFFKQERVGKNRKTFSMYKFRSMRHAVSRASQRDKGWTTADDPRRTRFGSFLRATSLDELPQFYNVLKGDMSIIGPRPERPYFVDQFKDTVPKYMIKHRVRPGITGWAQINGWRGDTSIEERIKCDLFYIENWSFVFDLKIFFLTFIKGFVNRNAY